MNLRLRLAAIAARPWTPRGVAWTGGLFIAATFALAGFDIVRSYQATVANTGRELDAQARVIAEQTARGVQAVDVVLRHLAEQMQTGPLESATDDELHAYLKEQSVGLVQIDGLVVFDAAGRVRAVSTVPSAQLPPLNVAAEDVFQRLRSGQERGLVIGDARVSPGNGNWVFPIGRRLVTRDGKFAGAVGAPGRIGYFQDFYRYAYPDKGTRVALLHRNGRLLARHPPAAAALGQRFAIVDELIAASVSANPPAPTRNKSPLDGVDRFGALRLVPDYPLVVIVTRDVDAALAPWREQAIGTVLRTLALGALAACLIVLAMRQFARLHSARASLEASQQRYALAAAGSDDGMWDWDFTTRTAFESARARELQGLPAGPEQQSLDKLVASLNLHPDDAPRREAGIQAHLDGLTPAYECEYRVRHADGAYRWVRVRALCTRDASGRPLRMAGSVSDIDARKRAEVALRESEERFTLAVAGSDDGIWDIDYVSGQAFGSHRGREIMGVPGAQETQSVESWMRTMSEHVHPDDRDLRDGALADHLAGRTPAYECEFRVGRENGSEDGGYRWVRARGVCIRDASGRPLRIAGSVSDIDARKRGEESLRLSEERYAIAMTGSHEGHWVWDFETDQLFASERLVEIFGLPPGHRIETHQDMFDAAPIHRDDYLRVSEALKQHLAGRSERLDVEYRIHRRGEGGMRWVATRAQCFRDAEGRAHRMAGATVDVTERRQAEAALRRSEERYQLAVDGCNEGLWDWDLASDELFLSARAQQLTFLEVGEPLRPRPDWIALTRYHPDDLARVRRAIVEHLRGATEFFAVEYRVQHHSGEWHWYRQRGVALRDDTGRPYRMAGSMEDITARKHDEAQREHLGQQLRQAQKLEAIGTLAGGIAHDFNNILSAILGYGELSQKDAPEGTALRRHIDASMSAGLRAKSLVERILAFSRSGMGDRVPVHVQSVVAEALDAVAASLPPGVRMDRSLASGDAGVLGDPTQIHQVVMNLCANAAQAMKSDGVLTVAVDVADVDAPRTLATSTLPRGSYVRLVVRDTGSGIAPQLLERIFDPFFTTKEVGVGTGLGLSLVHGIVTDLGGGIAVDSRPGEGATFTVYLPWQTYVAAPVAAEEQIAPGDGETILLVDDEEALVRLGEEMLAELGYEPVGFSSSSAALAAFRAEPGRFDAVLSDEAMPGLTGSEMVAEMRRLRPDVPVVLMSGFVSAALTARAKEAGVVDVLNKPLVSRDIARSLAAALRRHDHLHALRAAST